MKKLPTIATGIFVAAMVLLAAVLAITSRDDVTSVNIRSTNYGSVVTVTDDADIARITGALRSYDFVEYDVYIEENTRSLLLDFNRRNGETERLVIYHDYFVFEHDGKTYKLADETLSVTDTYLELHSLFDELAGVVPRIVPSGDDPNVGHLSFGEVYTMSIMPSETHTSYVITDRTMVDRIIENLTTTEVTRTVEENSIGWSGYVLNIAAADSPYNISLTVDSDGSIDCGSGYGSTRFAPTGEGVDTALLDSAIYDPLPLDDLLELSLARIEKTLLGLTIGEITARYGEGEVVYGGYARTYRVDGTDIDTDVMIHFDEATDTAETVSITYEFKDGERVFAFDMDDVYAKYRGDPDVIYDGVATVPLEEELPDRDAVIEFVAPECTIDYDRIETEYDRDADVWAVTFIEGDYGDTRRTQTVYVYGRYGYVIMIVYGE